jgi:hypothetical protein
MVSKQYIYVDDSDEARYYLVEIWDNTVTLKVKAEGWSDTWSLPLKLIKEND